MSAGPTVKAWAAAPPLVLEGFAMARLTMDHIRREGQGRDATSLHLSHRALSDVSCLTDFRNLERLDLSYNCLENLEGLSSCVNLKWLSVVENKLKSLKGVEGLPKLTVLNAGKNKLRSMDEVKSVTSLCALILNDNEISFVCKLDQLKHLNTLVLSRNPIHDIGNSLSKLTSITKLSLSHCQIESIGSSLVSCMELKEVRLAHNKITTLPAELARNVKLQNLDLGNNYIEKWSDLKVLSTMHNLKNLNLQGNPIAVEEKLAKKIKKLLPSLRIFNAKPIERGDTSKIFSGEDIPRHKKNDSCHDNVTDTQAEQDIKRKQSKIDVMGSGRNIKRTFSEDDHDLPTSTNLEVAKEKKEGFKRSQKDPVKDVSVEIKDDSSPWHETNLKEMKKSKRKPTDNEETDKGSKNEIKKKKINSMQGPIRNMSGKTKDEHSLQDATDQNGAKKLKKKSASKEESKFEGFDDADTPFVELIFSDKTIENSDSKRNEVVPDEKWFGRSVMDHTKKKKKKKIKSIGKGGSVLELLSPATEVGIGGPSTWDN